jgi:6-phosphogluconolactonase (cycloisomerase 2 family)
MSQGKGTWVALLAASAAMFAAPGIATAAVGDLDFLDCITSETESGPGGTQACDPFSTTQSQGANTGLDNPESVAVSPDGLSLYVAAGDDDALVRFDRDPATGELSFAFCFTGETETGSECELLPQASSNGTNSGLDDPEGVTVSPDGRSVYLTSRGDDSIVHFARNPSTGFVSYVGCITGEVASGPAGSDACAALPDAQVNGTDSGLDDPKTKEVAVSADGKSVYAGSELDSSVVRFNRNPTTGALSFANCITGDSAAGGAGTDACLAIPDAALNGNNSGLGQPRWVTVSPDDRSVYLGLDLDDGVARFDRNTSNGALTYRGCISGDSNTPCTHVPSATAGGFGSGLALSRGVDVSNDGKSLYSMGANDDSVARFDRNPETGALTYVGCLSGRDDLDPACALIPTSTQFGDNSGLSQMRSLELSSDDRTLYTATQGDQSVAWFDRDRATGALSFQGCITGDTDVTGCDAVPDAVQFGAQSGLSGPETAVVSEDGRSVYLGVNDDDAVARFSRVPDTDPPNTRITKKPKKETTKRKAKFRFKSNEPGSTFECKLDRRKFKPCDSPFKKKVKIKRHKFKVRAIDSAGNVDPTPAKRKWTVLEDL